MGKVTGWLKAHWAPALGIGLAILVAAWFFIFRKSSSTSGGVSSVTIPAAATGGATGGATGATVADPLQTALDNFTAALNTATTSTTTAAAGVTGPKSDPVAPTFWRNPLNGAIYLVDSIGKRWISPSEWGNMVGSVFTNVDPSQLASIPTIAGTALNPAESPAPPLGTPAGPRNGKGPSIPHGFSANLGTGGLGSGNSPSIAPGGPLKQLVPLPTSFSQPMKFKARRVV